MKKVRHLPKEKQVKKMEEQDKILAGLPDPYKEEKFLKRMGLKLKHMIKPKKVKIAELRKVKKEAKAASKFIEKKKPQKKKGGKR